MKDLLMYKGFKPVKFLQYDTDVKAWIKVDGLRYWSYLTRSCTCKIKDPIHGKHRHGCNTFMLSTCKGEDRTKQTKILKVRTLPHDSEYFDLHIQIGSIKYDGLVHLECTCGSYTFGDHTHEDCQFKRKEEMQIAC